MNFWAQNSPQADYYEASVLLVACCSLLGAWDGAARAGLRWQIFDRVQLGEFLSPKQPTSRLLWGLFAPCSLFFTNGRPGWGSARAQSPPQILERPAFHMSGILPSAGVLYFAHPLARFNFKKLVSAADRNT